MSSENPKEAPPGAEEKCEVTPDSEAAQQPEHGSDTTEEGSHDGQHPTADYVTCRYCGKLIKANWLKEHSCSLCTSCNVNFATDVQLREHQKRSKLEPTGIVCLAASTCNECGLGLWSDDYLVHKSHKRKSCLKRWIGQNSKERSSPAPATASSSQCQSITQSKLANQTDSDNQQLYNSPKRCNYCRNFISSHWFNRHKCSFCKECNTNFASPAQLREHLKRSKLENAGSGCSASSECPVCGLALWSNKPTVLENHKCEKTWIGQYGTKPNEEKGAEVKVGKEVKVPKPDDMKQMDSQQSNEEKYEQDNSPATPQQEDSKSNNQTPASAECLQKKPPESQQLEDSHKRCPICRKFFRLRGNYYNYHKCSFCIKCSTNFATYAQLREHQKRSQMENTGSGCLPSSQCQVCGLALWSNEFYVQENHKRGTCEKIWIGQRVTKPNEEKDTDVETGKEVKVPKNGDLKQMDSQQSNEEMYEQDNSPATPQQEDSQSSNQTPASTECAQKKPPESQHVDDLRKRCSTCRKSFILRVFDHHTCTFCINCSTNFATYIQLREHQKRSKVENGENGCSPPSQCPVCGLALWCNDRPVHRRHRYNCEKIWIGQRVTTPNESNQTPTSTECSLEKPSESQRVTKPNEEKGTDVETGKEVKVPKNGDLKQMDSQQSNEEKYEQDNSPATPQQEDSKSSNQTPASTECSQKKPPESQHVDDLRKRCSTCRKSFILRVFDYHTCSFCINCNTNFATYKQLRAHQKRSKVENGENGCSPPSQCPVCGLALWCNDRPVHRRHGQYCKKIWIGQRVTTPNESNQTPTSTECSLEKPSESLQLRVFNIRCHTCRKTVSSGCFEKHACSFCNTCSTNFATYKQLQEHHKRSRLENSGSGCSPSSPCPVCGLALWSGDSQVHKSHMNKYCEKIWIGQSTTRSNEEAMDGRAYSSQRCQHGRSPFECNVSSRDGLCTDWDTEITCPPVNPWGLRTFACSHCPVYGTELEIQKHIENAHDVHLSLEDLDPETLKARTMNSDASYLTKYENAAKKVKAGKCYICFKQIFCPHLIRNHIQWCQQLQRLHQNPPTDDQELPKDSCAEKKKVTFSSIAAVLIKGWKTKDSGIRNETTSKPQKKMEESLVKAMASNVRKRRTETEKVHSSDEMETDVEEKMCIDAETGNEAETNDADIVGEWSHEVVETPSQKRMKK